MQFQNKVEEEEKVTDLGFFDIGALPKKKRSSTDPELFDKRKIATVAEDYENENSDSEAEDYNQARKGGITQIFQNPPGQTSKNAKETGSPESSMNLTMKIDQIQLGGRHDTIYQNNTSLALRRNTRREQTDEIP